MLSALPHDLCVSRWDNRAQDGAEDAYVQFERDLSGKVGGMTMRVVQSDFSFDAQDLDPKKCTHKSSSWFSFSRKNKAFPTSLLTMGYKKPSSFALAGIIRLF